MAEAHPVGFRWVMKAKERGARVIHVDPRYGRTSQLADLHVPIRAGTDVAFLGGVIRHVIETESYFKEYVVSYTNAATIVCDAFRDTEDLDGLFSGFDSATGSYDPASWGYEDCAVGLSPGVHEHATQAFSEHTGAGMDLGGVRHDDTLQDPRCVFQVLRRHFSRYTPEMVERICGISHDAVHGGGRCADRQLRPGAYGDVLLCERLDAAFRGRADDSQRGDPPVAAGQRGTARGRDHGDARARVDPGLHGHPDLV